MEKGASPGTGKLGNSVTLMFRTLPLPVQDRFRKQFKKPSPSKGTHAAVLGNSLVQPGNSLAHFRSAAPPSLRIFVRSWETNLQNVFGKFKWKSLVRKRPQPLLPQCTVPPVPTPVRTKGCGVRRNSITHHLFQPLLCTEEE